MPLSNAVPELSEDTLMDRENNETLSKLNIVLALTDCIQEMADSRCAYSFILRKKYLLPMLQLIRLREKIFSPSSFLHYLLNF